MKKVISTVATVALLSGTANIIAQQPIAYAEEVESIKPTITNITVDKDSYQTDEVVTVRVTLDNIDAVKHNKIRLSFQTDNPLGNGGKDIWSGDDNLYSKEGNDLVLSLPPLADYMTDGVYHLKSIKLNGEDIDLENLTNINPTFNYTNIQKDTLKPEILDVKLNKNVFEVGEDIIVTVTAKDKSSMSNNLWLSVYEINNGQFDEFFSSLAIDHTETNDEGNDIHTVKKIIKATEKMINKDLGVGQTDVEDEHYNSNTKRYLTPDSNLIFNVYQKGTLNSTTVVPKPETPKEPAGNKVETPKEPTGNKAETPKEPAGNKAETPKEPAGNKVETPKEPAGNKVETPKEPAGNKVETPKEQAGNKVETPKEQAGNKVETPKEPAGNKVETPKEQTKNKAETLKNSVENKQTANSNHKEVAKVEEQVNNKNINSNLKNTSQTTPTKQHSILPKTGMTTTMWTTVAGVCGLLLAGVFVFVRKNK